MKDSKKKLLNIIFEKNRLLSKDEAFDFYVENVMRNQTTCKWNQWHNEFKGRYEDYPLWELEQKAAQWYKLTVGSLVLDGFLGIMINKY